MAWYLYNGSHSTSIATGLGNVVVVPAYGKVEIHRLTPTTQSMLTRRVLRPCGPPPVVVPRVAEVEGGGTQLQPTAFATWAVEQGVAPIPAIVEGAAGENVSAAEPNGTVGQDEPNEAGDVAATEAEGGKRRRR